MSGSAPAGIRGAAPRGKTRRAQEDPAWVRRGLVGLVLAIVFVLIVIPLANIFAYAFSDGVPAYFSYLFEDKETRHSILVTLLVVPIALVANVVFGIAAAWAIARFDFRGRSLLLALIDLPFAVSPVVAGLMFVLIFGLQGYFGAFLRDDGWSIMPWVVSFVITAGAWLAWLLARPLDSRARTAAWTRPAVAAVGAVVLFAALGVAQQAIGIWPEHKSLKIIFALPGLVLATAFVTFPFVARELIPVMEAVGADEDLAATSLGASGWQMFRHVTVPNIKWGLAYGIILCNARAMGEFGAVYVVSGRISGQTDTMPLRIEKLFQEYNLPGSFALASVLTLLALLTLVAKAGLERRAPGRRGTGT